ncbi:hypothetical protein OAU89_02825 [bacterium]|jgi:hypothetical protein|nr:hypothetical protein [bacterium]MDG1435126.1 hypothetical protein [Saprospiraceae bacterium]
MKKNFLTMMLLFAFLFAGIQNASSQYMSNSTAISTLTEQVDILNNNPVINQNQNQDPNYEYLRLKFDLYTIVYEKILEGGTVYDSIQEGVEITQPNVDAFETNPSTNDGVISLGPIHQELEDLLSL